MGTNSYVSVYRRRVIVQNSEQSWKSGLNVRIGWKKSAEAKEQAIRLSLTKPKCSGGLRWHTCVSGFSGNCTQTNVVYRLTYNVCEENGQESIYICETKRPVRLRFNEHIRDALNASEGTPMRDHFNERHPSTDVRGPAFAMVHTKVRSIFRLPAVFFRFVEYNYSH